MKMEEIFAIHVSKKWLIIKYIYRTPTTKQQQQFKKISKMHKGLIKGKTLSSQYFIHFGRQKCGFFYIELFCNSQILNACSTISLNSDTNCLELVQFTRIKDSVPQNCPLLQTPITSSGFQITHNFQLTLLQIRSSHAPLLRFDNLLKWFIEFKGTVDLLIPICNKGYIKGHTYADR